MPIPFQILTGACNTNGQCVDSGLAHGADIVAYGSGSHLFIFGSHFERLQIIQEPEQKTISAVACSNTGKIFFAAENQVSCFRVASYEECQQDKIFWKGIGSFRTDETIRALSCDADGNRVLTSSGQLLQLWQSVRAKAFLVGEDDHGGSNCGGTASVEDWEATATLQLENSIGKLGFSPDGAFFASLCDGDPFLKVWYKNTRDAEILSNSSPHAFTYLPHPYPVVSFSWRNNASDHFGSCVSNALLSVCSDRICRIWLELSANPSHTQATTAQSAASLPTTTTPNSLDPNRKTSSVVKVNFVENSCVYESFRQFHLVASISPFADLPSPLLAEYFEAHAAANFCVFWLNNKHMAALQGIDKFSNSKKPKARRQAEMNGNGDTQMFRVETSDDEEELTENTYVTSSPAKCEEQNGTQPFRQTQSYASLQTFRNQLRKQSHPKLSILQFQLLLREWIHSPDMVISFSPADGSFLLWVIDHLDKADGASFVQPTVTFTSCLPGTLPPSDAASLLPSTLLLYADPHNHVTVVTIHDNGSLNRWSLSLSEKSKHSTLVCMYHGQRICGHRTAVEKIVVHPILPIVMTQSPGELVFWKVTPTTQLHQSGGFAEVTRMMLQDANHQVAWVPTSLTGNFSPCGISPSTVFLLSSPNGISAMQVIIDAYTFFNRIKKKVSSGGQIKADDKLGIVSQQSASRPACVLKVSQFPAHTSDTDCRLFRVFPIGAFPMSQSNTQQRPSTEASATGGVSNDVSEYVAIQLVVKNGGGVAIMSYHVTITAPLSKPSSMEGLSRGSSSSPIEAQQHHPISRSSLGQLGSVSSSLSVLLESKMSVVIEPLSIFSLPLPPGVTLTLANAATSQSASSFLSNLCSPYQLALGCSDGVIRFWSAVRPSKLDLSWFEMKMPCDSKRSVTMPDDGLSILKPQFINQNPNAKIIGLSCAFSCRLAVACGRDMRPAVTPPAFSFNDDLISSGEEFGGHNHHQQQRLPFSCQVVVYECESTGGYKWNVEDTLEIDNEHPSPVMSDTSLDVLSAVKICWSPVHDGSHLLVVLLVDRVYIFAQISTEMASQLHLDKQDDSEEAARASEYSSAPQINGQSNGPRTPTTENRHNLLQQAPLMATSSSPRPVAARSHGVCWVRVRVFELNAASTGSSGPVLPTFVSLLQTGLLVVGLGSELQIFSQWQGSSKPSSTTVAQGQQERQIEESQSLSKEEKTTAFSLPVLQSQVPVQRPTTLNQTLPVIMQSDENKSPTSPTSPQQDSKNRSLADNVWLSVSSASFLQMHRSASFHSLGKHTGADAMTPVPEVPAPNRRMSQQTAPHKPLQRSNSAEQAQAAIRVLEDASLYELALATNPVLPQYHPKFLLELLKMGRVNCVDTILAHVVRSIFPDIKISSNGEAQGDELDDASAEDAAVDQMSSTARNTNAKADSNMSPGSNVDGTNSLNSMNAVFVRPIPLHEIWTLITTSGSGTSRTTQNLSASHMSTAEKLMNQLELSNSDLADTLTHSSIRARANSMGASGAQPIFTETMARLLSIFLSRSRLPGLSNVDQMYLLALAGLVSARGKLSDPGSQLYSQSLDDCGSRFLLDMRHHHYLARTLPMVHRAKIIQRGLPAASFLWAFHSESQDELLSLIPSVQRGEPSWAELRSYGVGFWLRSITSLRKLVEQLARSAFQKTKDPLDAAIFYLAMKKKTVLAALLKSHENSRLREFFKNDFTEPRWAKAALKNAFDLLAKQRFEHAVAFFLLAGSLRDAIEVCVSRLCDLQLALVIARLYEDSQQTYQALMKTEVLGSGDSKRRSNDAFLLSLAHWVASEHKQALSVLLDSSLGSHSDDFGHMTAVFGFYCHLKGHPLMRKLTAGRSTDEGDESLLSTHLERRTHFLTAHSYLKAGCPLLAINVIYRMPPLVSSDVDIAAKTSSTVAKADSAQTQSKAADLDWSQPIAGNAQDELVLSWSDEENEEKEDEVEDEKEEERAVESISTKAPCFVVTAVDEHRTSIDLRTDIVPINPCSPEFATNCVAEQLKFICCLRLLADELTALCGGQTSSQLHQQLFTWLQNEFHLVSSLVTDNRSMALSSSSKSLVHLPMNVDNSGDVHQLLENLTERRNWLAKNSQLLHCLLNFATLLAPTSTPLSLALNELCQLSQDLYAPRSHLTCKIPTTTSLPLVLAALSPLRACFQNVVSILLGLASDILLYLSTVDQVSPSPSHILTKLRAVHDLALTLSSSVYQSLCGCDLDPGRLRVVTTEPTKWPGVSQWSAMLQQFADPDCPRLYLLLTRCLIAVHSGLFVYALATTDARALYRLISNPLNLSAWNRVFGGAKRMPVRHHAPPAAPPPPAVVQQPPAGATNSTSSAPLVGTPSQGTDKHRAAMARRVMEQRRPSIEDKIVYTEEFIAPTTTLASYFLRKPDPIPNLDADVAQVINMDDVAPDDDDDNGSNGFDDGNVEHIDPGSRSWVLLRIALIEHCSRMYRQFLPSLGVEHQDLVQLFPLVHTLLAAMQRWSEAAHADLRALGLPPPAPEFVPDRTVLSEPVGSLTGTSTSHHRPFDKYACLARPDNTPFVEESSSLLCRRLWLYLVRQESLRPLFIRHVFGPTTASTPPVEEQEEAMTLSASQHSLSQAGAESAGRDQNGKSKASGRKSRDTDLAVKMLHKDQEPVGTFCINQNNLNCVALALSKEILQLDIGVMLHPPVWVESDLDYDIETMLTPEPADACNLFTVVTTRCGPPGSTSPCLPSSGGSHSHLPSLANTPTLPPSAPGVIPTVVNQTNTSTLTAYGANMLKNLQAPLQLLDRSRRLVKQLCKNNVSHARFMSAHPTQPFFLVGCQNKTVSCWQWGHWSAVVTYELEPRLSSHLSALKWSDYGNKFGIAEHGGTMRLCLSHVGKTNRPFWAQREAHSQALSDFCFLDSASVLATVGTSSDNINLRLWDTLLPPNSQVVQSYICHDGGCNTVAFSKRCNMLLTAGKKGEVAMFDLRRSDPLCLLPAHESSSIRCIAIDPMEKCFATGAADGDIKIWSLGHDVQLIGHLPGEHKARGLGAGFVSSQPVGVTQLTIDPEHRLYSCGADGSFRVRSLTSLIS